MILITATGHDRPGMVAAISQKLLEENCNIADATMTRLSGQFAMILAVTASRDAGSTPDLEHQLQTLRDSHGLQIHCNNFEREQSPDDSQNGARYVLSVYGPDNTGLVARVAGVLAAENINITDLQTRITGSNELYVMIFELESPPDLNVENLREELTIVTRELNLEFSLNAVEDDAL
jgi:glycine cleavage system transcriptional repressor